MVAIRCVRSDRPSLPAVAVCCSGCGLLPEESSAEKSHVFMRRAERTLTGNVNLMFPSGSTGPTVIHDSRIF